MVRKAESQSIDQSVLYNSAGPAAPLAWYGGKKVLARWIIEQMPNHRIYVEPYGGMANVLLKKQPSEVEIFNDLDGRVTNLFRVIRNPESLAELQRLCELTPYSRRQFAELCTLPEPTDPIERAHWFLVRGRQARGGLGASELTPSAWANGTRSRRKMPEPVSKYLSTIDGLQPLAARFRPVMIEELPAIDLIKKYDKPDALFYCDPPYPASTRSGGRSQAYAHEMTDDDHKELLTALRDCKGRVMISSYPSELYESLLHDWRRVEKSAKAQLSNSGNARTEVVWLNYEIGT
ncbi:MAG: DNA adenine methylase [Pirellulales bacterium]